MKINITSRLRPTLLFVIGLMVSQVALSSNDAESDSSFMTINDF
jgi:hypothetical protein